MEEANKEEDVCVGVRAWTCKVTQEQNACCTEGCTAPGGTNPCRLSSELHMFTAMCASIHTYTCMNKNLKNVKPLALGMVADIPAQEAESEDRVGGRLS